MTTRLKLLKGSLIGGAVYFLMMGIAHWFGMKVPFLFIYFNVPSEAYQDRIISILSIGWSFFLLSGALQVPSTTAIRLILISGAVALLGLAIINLTTDFNAMTPLATQRLYWFQWMALVLYFAWLLGLSEALNAVLALR